ncbi:hypothetical protein JRO89_XS01G0310200 [Xanthoceras sorbifolium]|uniref:Uncharacterized protein n=1 Tax=Xanthoceras sorbifolium TaxID=99658 RepID=A0ABQ8IME7_9ROSI|nr:hypothetical protein JRO89_XS01G0310200 [Xanthoceras sorbifolium]
MLRKCAVCRRNGSGSIAAEYVSWESRSAKSQCGVQVEQRLHVQPSFGDINARAFVNVNNNSPWPIPEGWKFETKTTKDGSQFSSVSDNNAQECLTHLMWIITASLAFEAFDMVLLLKAPSAGDHEESYVCLATGEHFYTYEGMMRCVNYTRETLLLRGWIPSFDFLMDIKNNVDDRSSESALDSNVLPFTLTNYTEATFFFLFISKSLVKMGFYSSSLVWNREILSPRLDGEVMTLETFLEKFLGSGANNVPPEVGFSREHEHIPTGNDNVEAPALGNTGFKMQLSAKPKISKSIKKRRHRPKKN